jgi:Flp pilus assembly protein TadG
MKMYRKICTVFAHTRILGQKFVARRKGSGQAMVELAIALPVLLLLAVGVIEMGRYMYIGILVGNAARAGAAYGARNLSNCCETTTPTGIQRAADNDYQSNGQSVGGLTVSSVVTCGCDSGGTIASDTTGNCFPSTPPSCPSGNWVVTVHVTASGSFSALLKYPGIPSPLAISRTASMRVAKF